MRFASLSILLGLSALVQSDNMSLRANPALQEMRDDEREAGPLCNRAVSTIKNTLEAKLPFDFTCSCTFRLFRPIIYRCNADVCFKSIMELIDVDMPLPITEESCIRPVASGTLEKRSGDMTTKVCSGATKIVLNITQIEEGSGMEISDDETFELSVPNSCLEVEHNANSLKTFTGCSASIAGKNCNCVPCEEGSGVQINCVELMKEQVPEFLHPVLDYTEVCLHPGLYDDIQGGQRSADPLALGVFGLMVSMNV